MLSRLTIILTITALVALAVLGWLVMGNRPVDPLAGSLATVGAALTVPGPTVATRVAEATGVLSEGLWKTGDDRVRVRVSGDLGVTDGEALGREERAVIGSLFEDHQAPYPGALSNTLACPDTLRPADLEPRGDALFLVALYANDRYAFGGCAEDLLQYRATVAAFYGADRRELVRVEYFEPKKHEGPVRGPAVLRSFRWLAQ